MTKLLDEIFNKLAKSLYGNENFNGVTVSKYKCLGDNNAEVIFMS